MKRLLLLLITICISSVSFGQVPSYVPTDSLVGWWGFNGNANDESGNENNGTVTDATLTIDQFGNPNSAYNFDYTGYSNGQLDDMIYVPDNNFNTPEISVSCWFKPTAWSYPGNPGSSAVFKRVENGYDNPPGEFWYIVFTDDGTLLAGVIGESGGSNLESGAGFIDLDSWYHVVLTYDGTVEKLYANGILIGELFGEDLLTVQGASGLSFGVSYQANGYWRPFNGVIDDSGIWNRALSACEVAALYSGQQTNPPIVDLGADTLSICGSSSILDATNAAAGTYSWSNGETTPSITVNSSGLYSVAVTDTNGCIGYDTTFVSIVDPTITASAETICLGDSTFLQGPLSGNTFYDTVLVDQFTMSFNSPYSHNTPVTSIGSQYLYKVEGDYAIWSCCTQSGTGAPRLDAAYYFATDNSDPTYERIQWCFNGVTPGIDISFFRPDNDIYQNNHTYWFSYTGDGSPQNFCFYDDAYSDNSGSLSFEIYELIPQFIPNDITWSTSDTTSSIWVTPGATTTYSVTVDDGIGSCTDDIEITVNDPQIDFGGDQTICSGDDLELDAGAGYNYYNWSTGETTQTITVSAAGTYTATVGDSTPVVNDHSMSFDGQDDYIEINNSNIVDNMNQLSINAWIKVNDLNISNNKVIISKWSDPGNATNRAFIIELEDIANTIDFRVNGSADFVTSSTSVISTNEWGFLSCVYDDVNGTISMYFNGNLIGQNSLNVGGSLMMDLNKLRFGTYNSNVDFFNGNIDGVQIWNTALSQSEIQNYMNCPPTGNESGLVGYWNFEEGSGTTVLDQTSNGNNGTINGATYDTDTPEQVCVSCTATSDVVVTEAVPTSSTDTQEACESFTWIDGNTYTDDNTTATFVTTNAAGCDSTITLDLTILESSSSTDIHEVCDEFTWIDGNTYTENNNNATFTTTNTAGCDSVITLNLTINNLTTLDAGIDQTVCEGTDITLTATGAAVYDWDDDIQNGVPFNAQLGSNTYTVEGTDANGCEDEQSVTITGTPYPELIFEVTDPACQGESSGNIVAVASNGTAPYSFVWNNGTLQSENNGVGAGTYEVTVTDDNECETQGSVVVIDPTEPCFFIPGGLTPNGDGANETWEIGGLSQYPDAKVMVFDRWGHNCIQEIIQVCTLGWDLKW